jgi:hypothetical protein
MRPAAAILACLFLGACGSGDEGDGSAQAPGPEGASLIVTVQPKGPDGPTRRRRINCERLGEGSAECRRLDKLTAKRMAPVPATVACAQIFGGPAQARVTGELRGEMIDARFSRTNACQIRRWNDNSALLNR